MYERRAFSLVPILDGQASSFNERKENDAERFVKIVAGVIGKGLRYAKLIGKTDGDGLPERQYPSARKRGC